MIKKMLGKIKKFLGDERGVGEDVFRMALIVIVVAVVLAVLALIWSSAQQGATALENKAIEASDKIGNTTLP